MTPSAVGAAGTSDSEEPATSPVDRRPRYRQLRPGPGKKRDDVLAHQRSRLFAATIELVAERGYDGMTVSKLVRMAGVSKASFYQQFKGKDECFLATFDTAVREAARVVLRERSSAGGDRDCLRAGLVALADLIAAQPNAAKLVLIDSLASTGEIREHACRRFGLLEALVRERLAAAREAKLPNGLAAGILRGIEHHARRCVGAERPERFRDLVDPLLDWGLALSREEAVATFSVPAAPSRTAVGDAKDGAEANGAHAFGDTRELLLGATRRLAAREGYAALTPSRIRQTAGVSRRSFDASYQDAGDCFLAAVDVEVRALFDEALQAGRTEGDWSERTHLVLERFTASLAADPDLAQLAFAETLAAAPASLRWRERLIADWAEVLYSDAPPDSRPTPVAAEASLAAVWGFVSDLVASRRLHLLPTNTSRLTLLTLAPIEQAESYERFPLSTRNPRVSDGVSA